ncbi:MAG: hypothetical protein SNJ59_16115 [Aggregatilineales bacterium]
MQTLKRAVTAEAFEAFVNLPENADRTFELIAGGDGGSALEPVCFLHCVAHYEEAGSLR